LLIAAIPLRLLRRDEAFDRRIISGGDLSPSWVVFIKQNFGPIYDHDDSYICPAGNRLRPSNRNFSTPDTGIGKDGSVR
jgi:hypothetical protein